MSHFHLTTRSLTCLTVPWILSPGRTRRGTHSPRCPRPRRAWRGARPSPHQGGGSGRRGDVEARLRTRLGGRVAHLPGPLAHDPPELAQGDLRPLVAPARRGGPPAA